MSELSIRPAIPADVPVIFHFVRALAEYERLGHLVTASEESLRDALFGVRPAAEVLLAHLGDEPAGFAVYFHTFSTFLGRRGLWLEDLFVLPERRGRGVGKALLLACARTAHARGCGRFEWTALDWNRSARDFYERLGARLMDEWKLYRVTGEALERLASRAAPVAND
ncbi:MAG: GNAT family N-acetyltransferase [Betaproteobacteria bacterium]|nr:GNAT family N-acetyltransferase [Betaproteobacteria bacterium]